MLAALQQRSALGAIATPLASKSENARVLPVHIDVSARIGLVRANKPVFKPSSPVFAFVAKVPRRPRFSRCHRSIAAQTAVGLLPGVPGSADAIGPQVPIAAQTAVGLVPGVPSS